VLVFATVVLVSGCSLTNDAAGDEILFVRETAEGTAIYLMSHDGREVRRLVEGTSPRWSPDGSREVDADDLVAERTRDSNKNRVA